MDTPPPAAVDELTLMALVTSAWPIELDAVDYVPKGAGSYHWLTRSGGRPAHFITVDDLDTKPWIGRDRESTFEGLTAAYETARVLNDEGVESVVAPIRGITGTVTARFSEQYSVAVCPYVDGTAGTWGEPIDENERTQLLRELARLHGTTVAGRANIRRRPHVLPERDDLLDALADLDEPWHGGEFSEPARLALTEHAPDVREMLARFDALAAQLDASSETIVVTHGEPHPGNLIHVDGGVRVIDWDTVALAEPERDLWMLDNGHDDAFDAYTAITATPINPAAIDYYGLAWTLSDIASFTAMFRAEHARTDWTEIKWNGFLYLLGGGASAPYGNR